MPIKQRNAVTKTDFEEALDYVGLSVSDVAKQTNIPRAYLSDLKNRNVRLRREHEDRLRSFLEDQGVEFEADDPPQRRGAPSRPESPHPDVEVAQVLRRSLALDDSQRDDVIAAALDAQADRDARLSQLFAMPIQHEGGLGTLFGDPFSSEFKTAIEEARRLLADSYLVVGLLRGLRGFKAPAPNSEPQTLGDILTQESAATLEEAGLVEAPPEPSPGDEPAPVPASARQRATVI